MYDFSVAEFKAFFDRGQFVYSDTLPDVRDSDIEKAVDLADCLVNDDLYADDATLKKASLYLTAHFLQLDIQSSESSGQPDFIQASRSANGVSESLNIPEWMREGVFSNYATTYYGQQFLQLSKPGLDGAVFVIKGDTTA